MSPYHEPTCPYCDDTGITNDGGVACHYCCPHEDMDHNICLDCWEEVSVKKAVDTITDLWEDLYKE